MAQDRDQYRKWITGPKLKATGEFEEKKNQRQQNLTDEYAKICRTLIYELLEALFEILTKELKFGKS